MLCRKFCRSEGDSAEVASWNCFRFIANSQISISMLLFRSGGSLVLYRGGIHM